MNSTSSLVAIPWSDAPKYPHWAAEIVVVPIFSNWAPSASVRPEISVTCDAAIVLLVSVCEPSIVTISPAEVPPTVTSSNWLSSLSVAVKPPK